MKRGSDAPEAPDTAGSRSSGDVWARLVDTLQEEPAADVWAGLVAHLGPVASTLPVDVDSAAAGVAVDTAAAGRCARCGTYCPACAPPPPVGWAALPPELRDSAVDDPRAALAFLDPPVGDGRRRCSPVDRSLPPEQRRPQRIQRGAR